MAGKLALGVLCADATFEEPESALKAVEDHYDIVDLRGFDGWDKETLSEQCQSVDVLLIGRNSPMLPAKLAAHPGRLKYVSHLYGGLRRHVPREIAESGIVVTNWGNRPAEAIAEAAFALLLTMLKQIPYLDRWSRQGGADPRIEQAYSSMLRDLRVGLVGLGFIGLKFAEFLNLHGAKAAFFDPYVSEGPESLVRIDSLEDLFSCSDAISIHCGLTEETRKLITGKLLDRLPQGGIVINTARGGIIDEAALAERVQAGRLLAGVDVIEDESDYRKSPLTGPPGAVVTHHRAASSRALEMSPVVPGDVVYNLRAFARGEPLEFVVDAERYAHMT